ncbi:CYGB1 protein, partial [Amia calva]|nr:CYGB1 protein [Amia calva]
MGCALSGSGLNSGKSAPDLNGSRSECPAESSLLHQSEPAGENGTGSRTTSQANPLTDSQKDLIRESWTILHQDIARVGIIMFIRLFETHPECKDVFFIFREIDDLQDLKMSKELQDHGLRY